MLDALTCKGSQILPDGLAAFIVDGAQIVVDTTDWNLREGDRAVVLYPDGRICVETICESAWRLSDKPPRYGMVQDQIPIEVTAESRSGVTILGRVVES